MSRIIHNNYRLLFEYPPPLNEVGRSICPDPIINSSLPPPTVPSPPPTPFRLDKEELKLVGGVISCNLLESRDNLLCVACEIFLAMFL